MIAPLIVLTSDFGTADAYVGIMKGVILKINPAATIIDLTHQIRPQDILQAAFVVGTSHSFFAKNTIHVVVVDPGVGTDRHALLLSTPTARFLAPDNGVLSAVMLEHLEQSPSQSGPIPVPSGCSAYQLTDSRYWIHPVSQTFHGRDIFAPVAAHLSLGVPPKAMGQPIMELEWLASPIPTIQNDSILGQIINIDRFGNLIMNVSIEQLGGAGIAVVEIKGRYITGLSSNFHELDGRSEDQLLVLAGSHGYLEIALRDGNAASELGVGLGESVKLIISPPASLNE
jgi:S-adenosylmethionine hydrolase